MATVSGNEADGTGYASATGNRTGLLAGLSIWEKAAAGSVGMRDFDCESQM